MALLRAATPAVLVCALLAPVTLFARTPGGDRVWAPAGEPVPGDSKDDLSPLDRVWRANGKKIARFDLTAVDGRQGDDGETRGDELFVPGSYALGLSFDGPVRHRRSIPLGTGGAKSELDLCATFSGRGQLLVELRAGMRYTLESEEDFISFDGGWQGGDGAIEVCLLERPRRGRGEERALGCVEVGYELALGSPACLP